jgi:hypothetical protein
MCIHYVKSVGRNIRFTPTNNSPHKMCRYVMGPSSPEGWFVSTTKLKVREISFCIVILLLYTPYECYFTKLHIFTKLRIVLCLWRTSKCPWCRSRLTILCVLHIAVFIIGKKTRHLGEIKWQNINTNFLKNQYIYIYIYTYIYTHTYIFFF